MAGQHLGIIAHTVNYDSNSIPTTNVNPPIAPVAIALLLPLIIALSIFARRHYHQRVMGQRIAKLERLWQLHYRQNIH